MRETGRDGFASHVVRELNRLFPGSYILRGSSSHKQGMPDICVLYKDKWAMLEVKASKTSSKRPNQEYYVEKLNSESYASFIYPENEQEVFDELQRLFEA